MRTMLVKPSDVTHEFSAKVAMSHWDDTLAGKLRLQGAEESFDNSDAAVLTDGSVTRWLDCMAPNLAAKVVAVEDVVTR